MSSTSLSSLPPLSRVLPLLPWPHSEWSSLGHTRLYRTHLLTSVLCVPVQLCRSLVRARNELLRGVRDPPSRPWTLTPLSSNNTATIARIRILTSSKEDTKLVPRTGSSRTRPSLATSSISSSNRTGPTRPGPPCQPVHRPSPTIISRTVAQTRLRSGIDQGRTSEMDTPGLPPLRRGDADLQVPARTEVPTRRRRSATNPRFTTIRMRPAGSTFDGDRMVDRQTTAAAGGEPDRLKADTTDRLTALRAAVDRPRPPSGTHRGGLIPIKPGTGATTLRVLPTLPRTGTSPIDRWVRMTATRITPRQPPNQAASALAPPPALITPPTESEAAKEALRTIPLVPPRVLARPLLPVCATTPRPITTLSPSSPLVVCLLLHPQRLESFFCST